MICLSSCGYVTVVESPCQKISVKQTEIMICDQGFHALLNINFQTFFRPFFGLISDLTFPNAMPRSNTGTINI